MTEVNVAHWKQANQIYNDLMDLTVSDALRELSQMEALNDEVKSLVLTLISTGNQPSQFFDQQVGANFKSVSGQFEEWQIGDHIGGYELLEEIGSGGMAKVYRAKKTDAESPKPVAIKIFNHPSLTSTMLDRFAVEQDILSGLSHPSIVNMHHGGNSDKGVPYIIMELIEGATDLDQFALSNKASLKRKVGWIVDAARGIAHAHNNLIVHRDIKPSNLLVDHNGQLKVVDFGIAKLMSKADAPQKTTIMALTPSFAAPEQINSGQISVTTDVFSLAAVCLALIIEDQPLPADRLIKSCAGDESHIWQSLRHHIKDKDLRNVLNQALQQNPQQRYRNMDLFADDLAAWLEDKPVQATPDSWWYRLQKFAIRRRALFATLVTLVVTLGLSMVLLTWQYNRTIEEAKKTSQVKNFMLNVFEVTHPDVNQGEALSALDLLQKARLDIENIYRDQPIIKAELLLAIGTAFYQVGDWEEAQKTLTEAYQMNPENQAVTLSLAEVLVALKQSERYSELINDHPEIFAPSNQPSARIMRLLAAEKVLADDYQAAKEWLQKAHESDFKNEDFPGLLKTMIDEANLALLQSEYQAGIQQTEQGIAQYSGYFPPTHSGILKLKNALSVLYTKTGEFKQAQTILEKMVALQQQYLGDDHPDLIQSMVNLSESYYSQGQLDAANDISTQAHQLMLKKFGPEHPKLIDSYNSLATVVFVQGDYEQALSLMESAIEISINSYGEAHVETSKLKRNYATALSALRRNAEAKEVLLGVLLQQQNSLGKDHNDTLYTQISVVRALSALDEHQQAIAYAEEAVAFIDANPDRTGPLKSNAMFALGFAYFEAENYAQAIEVFTTIEKDNIEDTKTANFMVLSKAMARSFQAMGQLEEAANYAQKSIDLSTELIGAESIRTVKVKLLMADILVASGQADDASRLLQEIKALVIASDDRDRENLLRQIDELLVQSSTQ